jgi:hypothetical protein
VLVGTGVLVGTEDVELAVTGVLVGFLVAVGLPVFIFPVLPPIGSEDIGVIVGVSVGIVVPIIVLAGAVTPETVVAVGGIVVGVNVGITVSFVVSLGIDVSVGNGVLVGVEIVATLVLVAQPSGCDAQSEGCASSAGTGVDACSGRGVGVS